MRVCVVGTGPWPCEPGAIVTGPCIRLRQFVEPLAAQRHEVISILLEEHARPSVPIKTCQAAISATPEEILHPELLARRVDLAHTGAVIGVGSLMPVASAARLAGYLDVPCWVDYFGDPLAELHAAQLRQGGTPDITVRDHVWKFVRESLLAGDMFSTVSAPQRHALLGQLGLLGRYGNHWDISRRVHEIPCGVPTEWTEPAERPPFPQVLRDHGVPPDAPFVYFGGSWNVWLDEVTMARALAGALGANNDLRFVCMGVPTGPAGEAIRATLFRDLSDFVAQGRAVDLPPQDAETEGALLAWAGACLSLDRPIPEAELGSRNRLLAMIRWGAFPVVSVEAGLEALLVAEGLAAGIHDANAVRASKEILKACARTPERREEDRARSLDLLKTLTFERTLEPVVDWIAHGARRWTHGSGEGLLDRWAAFPADPEKLFPDAQRKRPWPFR